MKRIQEIIRGNSTSGLKFISKNGNGELIFDPALKAFKFTEDVVNKNGVPISGGVLPNASPTVVGGIKLRLDVANATAYITTNGVNP